MIAIFCFTQCKRVEEEPNFIKNIKVREQAELKKYSAFYIVPPTVCISCGSHPQEIAHLILKENYQVKVFFECFPENFETIVLKLKKEGIFNKTNYVIDTMLLYNQYDNVNVLNSPTLIYLKNGQVKKFETLNSETPHVLNNLINKIANKNEHENMFSP